MDVAPPTDALCCTTHCLPRRTRCTKDAAPTRGVHSLFVVVLMEVPLAMCEHSFRLNSTCENTRGTFLNFRSRKIRCSRLRCGLREVGLRCERTSHHNPTAHRSSSTYYPRYPTAGISKYGPRRWVMAVPAAWCCCCKAEILLQPSCTFTKSIRLRVRDPLISSALRGRVSRRGERTRSSCCTHFIMP